MEALPLRPGETAIRADTVVAANAIFHPRNARLTNMLLTTERILLRKPKVPRYYTIAAWISAINRFAVPLFYIPLQKPAETELNEVKRLWKWRPEFSGPPALQIGDAFLYFMLVDDRLWRRKEAPKEAVREHFEAVEAAWTAARSRATQQP